MGIADEALIGQVLDHYRVVSPLGAGGMGEVYLAKDEELGRDVALKVLSREDAEADAVRSRLLHEARLASALNHPNICTIYHVGIRGAQPFIAMEYVAGRTLADTLLGGPLAREQALAYAMQIADALEHAHAKGVIHRDLKCANVIVSAGQRVKVLDFGLAARVDAGALDAATMTAASLSGPAGIVGTLPYMAPEILRGGAASATSDVWAFGILLYEMLAGERPFQGQSAYDLTTSIMRDEPKAMASRVPAGILNILKRCLTKDPAQRYANGGELRAALEAAAAGMPVKARIVRASWALRAGLALGAVAVAALCVWGTLRLLHKQHTGPDSVAVLPFSNENGSPENEYLIDGLTDDLIEGLGRMPNLKVIPRTSVFRYKGKAVSASDVGRDLSVDAVLKGTVRVQGGGIAVDAELVDSSSLKRLWSGRYARPFSESAELKNALLQDIAAELGGKAEASNSTAVRSNEAYQAYLKGIYHLFKHTPEELEQARQYFEMSLAADPRYAPAYAGLSSYYSVLADSGLAPPASTLLKGRAAAQKALQLDPNVMLASNVLAFTRMAYDWDFRGAEADFRKLIAAQPNTPENFVIFAICLRTLGKKDEAIEYGRKALALDPLNVESSAGHAWNLYFAHRFDESISQFRDTLVLDPSYAAAHFGLALSFQQKKMEAEAAGEFEKYMSATAGEESATEFRKTYRGAGYKAAVEGLWKMQLDVLQERAQQEYVSPMLFASTYALLDRKEEAFKWLDKAMEEHSVRLLDLKVDPDFDSLRADPRFSQLTQKIGLP